MVALNPASEPLTRCAASSATLITGAASGIGREFAISLAARARALVLVDRARRPLKRLAGELSRRYGLPVYPLVADLAHPDTPLQLLKHSWKNQLRVDTLINSAAVGVRRELARQSLDSIRQEIDVNVTAVTHLIRIFLPSMIRHHSGTIINVASVAAYQKMPMMAVYGGSKSFLNSITESLAMELEGTGVYVALLCPGVTKTPFLKKLGLDPSDVPSNAQTPAEVVQEALVAIDHKQPRIVTGLSNRLRVWSDTMTPRRVIHSARSAVRRAKKCVMSLLA